MNHDDIRRLAGTAPGRSRAVAYGGFVWTVATARNKSPSVGEQTREALAILDANLAEAGSDKSRILSATVYITDMAKKPAMNDAWLEWVDPANEPQRACVAVAQLDGQDLVEIVVVAAAKSE